MRSNASRFFAGTRKGLFTIEKNGSDWQIASVDFLGDPVTMLLPDGRDGSLYAALNLGHFGVKLHRGSAGADGRREWKECAAPAYPKEENVEKAPAVTQIWALEGAGKDRAGSLWAGTLPGGLFQSDDSGESWRLVESLWNRPERKEWFGGGAEHPGIHSILVDPRDSRHVGIGVSCGGYWVTADGGTSWELRADGMRAAYMPPERAGDPGIQDPHRIASSRANPDDLWAQHHNGVFHSINGGRSWKEIENVPPSVFGFAVAVHPSNPETVWLVPATKDERRVPVDGKVVVARTRDGGKSFDVLRQGLPQAQAYDLVLRHALDVDESGNRLAFGSTTGNLWVSEDEGESWATVSHHLPPVYCVRWG